MPASQNHYPNISQIRQYGDSIRVEVEQRGDTLIEHIIDLKGTTGTDKFDDSHTRTSVLHLISPDSIVRAHKEGVNTKETTFTDQIKNMLSLREEERTNSLSTALEKYSVRMFLVETYRTDFSGGENIYVITTTDDTLHYKHILYWIN